MNPLGFSGYAPNRFPNYGGPDIITLRSLGLLSLSVVAVSVFCYSLEKTITKTALLYTDFRVSGYRSVSIDDDK